MSEEDGAWPSTYAVGTRCSHPWLLLSFLTLINFLNYVDRGIIPGAPNEFASFVNETILLTKHLDHMSSTSSSSGSTSTSSDMSGQSSNWPMESKSMSPLSSSGQTTVYFALLISSFIISFAICSLIFGFMRNFYSPFFIIGVGLFIWVGATVVCGCAQVANSYYLLLLGRILSGVGEASFNCVAPTLIDDHAEPSWRTFFLGVFFSMIPVGTAVGYEYGALFATSDSGWKWAFWTEALLMLPLVVASFSLSRGWDSQCTSKRDGGERGNTAAWESKAASTRTSTSTTSFLLEKESGKGGTRTETKTKNIPPFPDEDIDIEEDNAGGGERGEGGGREAVFFVEGEDLHFGSEVRELVTNRLFLVTVLGTAVVTGSMAALGVYGPTFLLGFGMYQQETQASLVFALITVFSGVIGTPVGGYYLDRVTSYYIQSENSHSNKLMSVFLALRHMTVNLSIGIVFAILGWLCLAYRLAFFFFTAVSLIFFFSTLAASSLVILYVVPTHRRSLAIAVNTLLIHLLGDVPSPIVVGSLKDTLAPHCHSIVVGDGKSMLDPTCQEEHLGLALTMLVPILWLILAALLWKTASGMIYADVERKRYTKAGVF